MGGSPWGPKELGTMKTKFQELKKFSESTNENIFGIVQGTLEINHTLKPEQKHI